MSFSSSSYKVGVSYLLYTPSLFLFTRHPSPFTSVSVGAYSLIYVDLGTRLALLEHLGKEIMQIIFTLNILLLDFIQLLVVNLVVRFLPLIPT